MKGLMRFLKSATGRKFYNFAYCWGACLVILGAVFKIAHMPFDNILLMVGMFTEVFIFFISAFDTPDEGYRWEIVFPALRDGSGQDMNESLSMVSKEYTDSIKALEHRINEMNVAFDEQAKRMKSLARATDAAPFEKMKAEADETARLLRELNLKYASMLEVLGDKKR